MLEHGVFALIFEDERLNGDGWQIREQCTESSCGMLLASVMSAITKRAMCASVDTVSVRSRLAGFSKSNRIGM